MKVVYIAGPFRGPNAWEIEKNIRRAEELSFQCWANGFAAICPHANTRFFDGALSNDIFLEGDLEIVRRCDALLMTADWALSAGAMGERSLALDLGIPVFHSIEGMIQYFNEARN